MALIELLDQHVNQAVTVHLIEAAIAVYQAAGGSPSQANAAMDQVRCLAKSLLARGGEGRIHLLR